MFAFQQSGLILLAEIGTPYEVVLEPAHHKGALWWQLTIWVDKGNIKEQGILHNAHGKVRLFKQLNSAIDFLSENCKHIKDVKVKLEDAEKPL